MGNASACLAAAGAFLCCWAHLPGEGARALAAVPCCALLLLLQEDGRLLRGAGYVAAVPLGALSGAWAGSAAYYVLLKVGAFSFMCGVFLCVSSGAVWYVFAFQCVSRGFFFSLLLLFLLFFFQMLFFLFSCFIFFVFCRVVFGVVSFAYFFWWLLRVRCIFGIHVCVFCACVFLCVCCVLCVFVFVCCAYCVGLFLLFFFKFVAFFCVFCLCVFTFELVFVSNCCVGLDRPGRGRVGFSLSKKESACGVVLNDLVLS